MVLRITIIVLLVAVVITLFMSASEMFRKDGNRLRAMALLGVRVAIAAVLLLCIGWGLYSGELTLGAPWSGRE